MLENNCVTWIHNRRWNHCFLVWCVSQLKYLWNLNTTHTMTHPLVLMYMFKAITSWKVVFREFLLFYCRVWLSGVHTYKPTLSVNHEPLALNGSKASLAIYVLSIENLSPDVYRIFCKLCYFFILYVVYYCAWCSAAIK